MAITFPLTPPTAPGFQSRQYSPTTIVGINTSPFTGQQQVFPSLGQWIMFTIDLPPMKDAVAALWTAFFSALNSSEGTFYLGDSIRKTPLGTIAGTVTVGTGAVSNTTTLPLSGGTGAFAVGDWLQVFTGASSRLHRVMQVNSGSVDVFPRLRSAYASGSAISYTNPKGIFRLSQMPVETFGPDRTCQGMEFIAMEAI